MVNFDPVKLTARVDVLEAKLEALMARLNSDQGHTVEAGTGATLAALDTVTVDAKDVGAFEPAPPLATERSVFNDFMERNKGA